METYQTELGYIVRESTSGLDIYDDESAYICTLSGKTLADYTYESGVNDDELEADIKEEIGIMEFIDDQQGNW